MQTKPQTRIQTKNRQAILDAALEVFSTAGFGGTTLDQIAEGANLSTPNLLYYFASKEAIYNELLTQLLATWLDPLRAMNAAGDPLTEIMAYVERKLELSRYFPRESRLFATEIIQGAPKMRAVLEGELHDLVTEKSTVLRQWMQAGQITPLDPVHLIFSIWAMTQHYADFDTQVRAVLGDNVDPFAGAIAFLKVLFTRLLAPEPTRFDQG